MKLLFSVPSGYHLRELVLPLRSHLEANAAISEVHLVTPAASQANDIFKGFGVKFHFHENPKDDSGHKELLSAISPNVVITNTVGHDALDEPLLRIAHELSIATVTFIASWDNVWKIDRLIASRVPIFVADRFIVWNAMMKQHLMRTFPTVTQDRIAVIGAPRLDYFSKTDHIPSKEVVYSYLGFKDTSRPFIHIATTELYPMEYIVQALRENIDSGAIPHNPYLYASVHPGGSMDRYEAFEKYGVTVKFSPGRRENATIPSFKYVPTDEDVFLSAGIFTHAGLLVNHSSTTALESLIANVPVINVRYGMILDWWNWYRSMVYRDFQQHYADLISDDATYVVRSKREFIEAARDALNNPSEKSAARDITVEKMITTIDGSASSQVLSFITRI